MNIKAEQFSLSRFALLLKRDFIAGYRSLFISLGAVTAVLLVVDMLNLWQGTSDSTRHQEMFSMILFIGGFIVTSLVFKEVHRKETNQNLLLLPASPLEKVANAILISNFGWIAVIIVWSTLFNLLSYGLGELIFGAHYPIMNPLSATLRSSYANYFVLQSFFLVGAIYFRKFHFFKTILSMFVFGVVFGLVMMLFMRIFFAHYFEGFLLFDEIKFRRLFVEMNFYRYEQLFQILGTVRDVLYWGLIAPTAWVITYVRFREVQVKDGI